MQHVNSVHSAGTVGLSCGSLARYSEFWMSTESVQVPVGSRLIVARGCDIAHQFNQCVRQMTGDWVWFLGDDHTFSPDLLLRLLDHNVDVVVPLIPSRVPPFKPCMLKGPLSKSMTLYRWSELPSSGLYELPRDHYIGQACMLVRKRVLDAIGDPWFQQGQFFPDRLQEDLWFCRAIQQAGFTVNIDCDRAIGHMANLEMLPRRVGGQWRPGFLFKGAHVVMDDIEIMPIVDPAQVIGTV